VRKVTTWLKANRHQPVRSQQAHLAKMLNGHYQYCGLYFCWQALNGVWWRVRKVWRWALRGGARRRTAL